MRKNKTKLPVTMYAAALLFCLVLITAAYRPEFYARYVTRANGSDGARVAKYDVTVSELSARNLTLNSFDDGSLRASTQLTVTSNSEVDVKYSVVVNFPRALPDWVHLTLNGSAPSVNGSAYTFRDVGTFDAGGEYSDVLTLEFSVDPGLQSEDLSLGNITVDVIAEQIN